MHRPWPRRLLALAWLLGWLAPPVVSLALLAHVASEHHHDRHVALELALAATHGHSHHLTFAEHEHTAVRESGAPALRTMLAPAHAPAIDTAASLTPLAELSDPPTPTGSPPLFSRNCALLL